MLKKNVTEGPGTSRRRPSLWPTVVGKRWPPLLRVSVMQDSLMYSKDVSLETIGIRPVLKWPAHLFCPFIRAPHWALTRPVPAAAPRGYGRKADPDRTRMSWDEWGAGEGRWGEQGKFSAYTCFMSTPGRILSFLLSVASIRLCAPVSVWRHAGRLVRMMEWF